MRRYAQLVTNYPWLPMLVALLLTAVCGPIAVWHSGIPDFSSPYKGLTPKGTTIQGRDQANVKLTSNVLKGIYTTIPGVNTSFTPIISSSDVQPAASCQEELITGVTVLPVPPTLRATGIVPESTALPRLVTQPTDPSQNLWTAQHMKDTCNLIENYITSVLQPPCEPFSLPYYLRLLYNKNCDELTEQDMEDTLELLQDCAQYYYSEELTLSCDDTTCLNVPSKCSDRNIVFYILHYFTDVEFLKNGSLSQSKLRYSLIIFRRSWNISVDDMYSYYKDNLGENVIKSGSVEVKAMDVDILFGQINSDSVLADLAFFALAMAMVVIALLIYLRSFSLMAAVMGLVGFTVIMGYFTFHIVYGIPFFGFGNVIIGLLLIAISADGVFIFHDVFYKIKYQAVNPDEIDITDVLAMTLKHGFLSVLVTSVTTSAAVFSNSISNIVALRTFGIFGGTCMIINVFYLMAFVPSILVILEKVSRKYPRKCTFQWLDKCMKSANKFSKFIWDKIFPKIVIKGSPLWIILLIGLAAYGFTAVFYKPALQLPSTEEIQVFYADHPIEVYRLKLRDQFRFELYFAANSRPNIEVKYVFGVRGEDNSNVLDPDDDGILVLDSAFNMYTSENQIWMKEFCTNILQDELLNNSSMYHCFMDEFETVVTSPCFNAATGVTINSRCCATQFPLSASDAEFCFKQPDFISTILASMSSGKTLIGIPVYDNDLNLVSFSYTVETSKKWEAAFQPMRDLYLHYSDLLENQLVNVPQGLEQCWFTGAYGQEFYFYDLQKTLIDGIISGIALAMAVAFVVMLLTSDNFLISLYAIVNISFVIAVTTAVITLLEWEIGVMEAIVIMLAVGLSIDFTIHLGVGYKVSHEKTRTEKVHDIISTIGFAVTMAAVTTFLAGSAMSGGKVLSYYRFGLFLMVNMVISWSYAMFFFLPVLRYIGPTGNIGKLSAFFHLIIQHIAGCCRSKEGGNDNINTHHKKEKNITAANKDINSNWEHPKDAKPEEYTQFTHVEHSNRKKDTPTKDEKKYHKSNAVFVGNVNGFYNQAFEINSTNIHTNQTAVETNVGSNYVNIGPPQISLLPIYGPGNNLNPAQLQGQFYSQLNLHRFAGNGANIWVDSPIERYNSLPAVNNAYYFNGGNEYYDGGRLRLGQYSSALFDPRSKAKRRQKAEKW